MAERQRGTGRWLGSGIGLFVLEETFERGAVAGEPSSETA
jgi:hypothetical protein